MAKSKGLLFRIFLIGICVGFACASIGRYSNKIAQNFVKAAPVGNKIPFHDSVRLAVQRTYRGEKDVRELTGKNDGKRIDEYLKAANLKSGLPYCAAGVTWVFKQHGIKTVVSGWSPAWFPDSITIYYKKKFTRAEPTVADVFGIYVQRKKRIGHVGFIDEKWENGTAYINTFEFNTSGKGSDDGEGNYHLRRLKSQIHKVSSPISKLKE